MKGKEATVEDIKYANAMIKKARNKTSKVSYNFSRDKTKKFSIYGMGDASYRAGEKAIGGQFVFLGDD